MCLICVCVLCPDSTACCQSAEAKVGDAAHRGENGQKMFEKASLLALNAVKTFRSAKIHLWMIYFCRARCMQSFSCSASILAASRALLRNCDWLHRARSVSFSLVQKSRHVYAPTLSTPWSGLTYNGSKKEEYNNSNREPAVRP